MNFENCKTITLSYELRVVEGERKPIVEKTTADNPLQFITGLGMMLPDFEAGVSDKASGEKFDFWIPCDKAYGEYYPERVQNVPIAAFQDEEGKVDDETVYVGARLQMVNEDGQRFIARVKEIGEDTILMDFNNDFAGKDLHFNGTVFDSHPSTPQEIQNILTQMSGGCGGCGGNCGDGGCGGCKGGCKGC